MRQLFFALLTLTIICASPVHALTVSPTPTPFTDAEFDSPAYQNVAAPVDSSMGQAMPIGSEEKRAPDSVEGAPADLMIPPIVDPQQNGATILGQDHSYSVTFRGNGEAVVTMKVVFSNMNSQPLTELKLTIPKITPKDVVAYQLQREPQCLRYQPAPFQKPIKIDEGQAVPMNQPQEEICAEYGVPNYFDYWYGKTTYSKSDVLLQGDTVTVPLPIPVQMNESGSILLQYHGMGYAKKNWAGGYHFDFETAQVADKIRNLQIGISTDSDLQIRGSQGEVNYRFTEAAPAMMKMDASTGGFGNSQMDNLYQGIGYGTVNKNASNLQPNDSYSVDGDYGKNWLQLYANEVIIGLIIALGLLAGMVVLAFFLWKRYGKTVKGNGRSILEVIGVGFVTALIIAAFTGMLMLVSFLLSRTYWYDVTGIIMLGLAVISAGIFLFLFISPALVMGVKRGVWSGIGTAAATIVWLKLFFLVAVFVIILLKLSSSNEGYPVYPLMKSGMMMDSSSLGTTPMQIELQK